MRAKLRDLPVVGAVSRHRASIDVADVRWWLAPGQSPADLGGLLEAAAKIPRGGAGNIKSGRRKEMHRLSVNGRCFLVKISHYDSNVSRFRRLRAGKARRELRIACTLEERGIETPLPVAAGERRSAGMLEACYLVVPVLEGAADFGVLWRDRTSTPALRREWARELGSLARRVHDAGLVQNDFAPNNFLVRGHSTAKLLPIDFERAHLGRAPVREASRVRMLATLDRHLCDASATARMRLLNAYFAGDRRRVRAYWRAITAAAPVLARRDFAHIRRTCAKEGRRFRGFAAGKESAWRGWARRDSSALDVVERDLSEAESTRAHSRMTRPRAGRPRVEERGTIWRVEAEGFGERRAVRAWATAQLLWMRSEMTPRPVAMLRRGTRTYLWLERSAECQRLDALLDPADREPAERAGRSLIRRLTVFGRFEREIQPHEISVQMREGRWRAQLLDVTAFWPGRTT